MPCGAAASSSSSSSDHATLSATCGSCRRNVLVQRPVGSHDFQFGCPDCGCTNQVSGTIDARCGGCQQVIGMMPPPGGGSVRFCCPLCNQTNQMTVPKVISAMCANCRHISQVQAPTGASSFTFNCASCNITNQVNEPSAVMCTHCRRLVQVQRPPGGCDFSFPCPHCGMQNRVKDSPKDLTIMVPEEWSQGDMVRIDTPEGLKMESAVPPGVSPGGTFTIQYQPRKLARESAQERLPLHSITDEELCKAPDDLKECPICMEEYRPGASVAFFPCFHRFHEKCAKASLAESTRCPMCNQEFHEAANKGEELLSLRKPSAKITSAGSEARKP
eukprot:TRINITY_DN9349_c0_g3_i2.p1 TRINITY_DN9349_c0_g3~~TRINITY_DN9349_c0_g3_i2.p1  ORF type:complete len:331 (+),score=41.75 TRINITY_DN9349_c0_g3_i2:104-1096(+)